MINITRILIITAATCTLGIAGCGDKDTSKDSAEASANSIENTIIDPKVDESKFGPPTELTKEQKADPETDPIPRYWVPHSEVATRLERQGWRREWLYGWRKIKVADLNDLRGFRWASASAKSD